MTIVTDLQEIPIFAGLSKQDLAPLARVTRLGFYGKGELICQKGAGGKALYILRSGRARTYTTDAQDRQVTLNLYKTGDFFGELALLDGLVHSANVATLEPSELLILERRGVLDQMEAHPPIALRILAALSGRLRATTERTERMAFLNIYGRLALQLLELAEQHGQPGAQGIEIDLDLTPEDMAGLAGIDPEGLERALQFYSDAGLVSVHWPHVTVRDVQGLHQRLGWHRRKRLV